MGCCFLHYELLICTKMVSKGDRVIVLSPGNSKDWCPQICAISPTFSIRKLDIVNYLQSVLKYIKWSGQLQRFVENRNSPLLRPSCLQKTIDLIRGVTTLEGNNLVIIVHLKSVLIKEVAFGERILIRGRLQYDQGALLCRRLDFSFVHLELCIICDSIKSQTISK